MSKIPLDTCRWINKKHPPVGKHSCSTRGTEVATTEGWWLLGKLPECSAPKTQTIVSRLMHVLPIYLPTLCISIMFMMSLNDVMIVCFPPLAGQTLCICRRATPAHLHIFWHSHQLISVFPTATHRSSHLFHIPNSEPVTYTYLCNASCPINCTIVFLRSRWQKSGATWPFQSCGAISTGISIKWCRWYHQWHHCIPYVKMIKMECKFSDHVMPTAISITWHQ